MAMLKNQRHELFAQGLAAGKTVTEAKEAAGIELTSCRGVWDYYVYLLVDPRSDEVFYVGKGVHHRAHQHVKEWLKGKVDNVAKCRRIGEIIRSGNEVQALCFQGDMEEEDALDLEQGLICAIGLERLTNVRLGGVGSGVTGPLAKARDLLSRMRSFDEWKSSAIRSGKQPDERYYWMVWHGLCAVEKMCVLRHAKL